MEKFHVCTKGPRWEKGAEISCMCVLKITHISREIYGYLKASPQILFSSLRKKIVMCKILRSLKFESSEAVVEYYEIWKCNVSIYIKTAEIHNSLKSRMPFSKWINWSIPPKISTWKSQDWSVIFEKQSVIFVAKRFTGVLHNLFSTFPWSIAVSLKGQCQ